MRFWRDDIFDYLESEDETPPIKMIKDVSLEFNETYRNSGIRIKFSQDTDDQKLIGRLYIVVDQLRFQSTLLRISYPMSDWSAIMFSTGGSNKNTVPITYEQLQDAIVEHINSKETADMLVKLKAHIESDIKC